MADKKKICIIACGQLSTNPRALKELRALKEAGYDAIFIGSYCAGWALKYDAAILAKDGLNGRIIDWSGSTNPFLFYKVRLRYFIARHLYTLFPFRFLERCVLYCAYPELKRAVLKEQADLYIAHNLAALPIAYAAAGKYGVKFAFDAEDFHSADSPPYKGYGRFKVLVEHIERKYLPYCGYITASSQLIARAYSQKYAISNPIVLLNVFPLTPLKPEAPVIRKGSNLSLYWLSQTIGRNRGLEDIVCAMGKAKANIKLYLQGSIRGDYKTALQDLAAKNNIEKERIIFLGPAFPDDLVNIASSFDVGLALEIIEPPSRDLCVSNKIFIYLLAGLSIIATRTQGQEPIIESIGKAGWLYRCGDIDALAGRIDYLAFNKAQLEESKKEASRSAHEKYNWDLEKRVFLGIITNILR